MVLWRYSYIDLPRITRWVAEEIIRAYREGLGGIYTTLDLGLSTEKITIDSGGEVVLRGRFRLEIDLLEEIDWDKVYEVAENRLRAVLIGNGGVYKLKPVSKSDAPTLEINGIHMHRIVGTTPWRDSLVKVVDAKVRRGHRVLDTCLGLGYTSIHSMLRGARVESYEIDQNVLEITRHNPWSRKLSDIVIHHGDIVDNIINYPDESFHRIIHDPPRLTPRTGDLYSLELYREFYRVLKPNGILYHYTGEPGRHGGPRIVKGVGERLRRAGFIIRYSKRSQGYICIKRI